MWSIFAPSMAGPSSSFPSGDTAASTQTASFAPLSGHTALSTQGDPGGDADSGEPLKKKRRCSAKKSFDAYLKGRRAGKRPDFCIPKMSFQRVVHHLVAQRRSDLRVQQEAIDILQETAEFLLTDRFQKCARLAELCKVDTVTRKFWGHVRDEEEERAGV